MKRTQWLSLVALGLLVAATVAHASFLRSASPLAAGNGRSYLPILYRDSKGMIYLAWTDARREKYDLYLARSKDGGRTWSEEIRIDAVKTPEVESAGPAFADGKGGALHAVWFATHAESDVRVMHAVSRNQGVTWSPPRQLNVSPGMGYEPQIASDGAGHLYVTWYEQRAAKEPRKEISGFKLSPPQMYDVYFTASDDDGASWRAPVRLNPRDDSPVALGPQIAYGGAAHVYLLWQEKEAGRPLGIYVAASPDHGKTWPVRGLKIDRGNQGTNAPRLVADRSGHVYAAWNDSREVTFAVYFNTSADHGHTWLAQDVRLGRTPLGKHHSFPPRLALSPSGRVFVTWMDTRNHTAADVEPFSRNDVFLTASNDYGKTWWTSDARLNTPAAGSTRAAGQRIVSDLEGRRVAVAWSDNRTGREGVYLAYSTNGGRTWLKTEIPVDKDATPAQRGLDPALLMEPDGAVLVAWQVGRTGQAEGRSGGRPLLDVRVRRVEVPTQ
jgi:hypothetical protein